MDRRIQKTQEAIFEAFFSLLNEHSFHKISVGEIIEKANIGRSTFYSHFSSKDELLTAVCEKLFNHVFVTASYSEHASLANHAAKDSLIDHVTHIFYHFKENDEKILTLFKMNDDYFTRSLRQQLTIYLSPEIEATYFKTSSLPKSLIQQHIVDCFISCLDWWLRYAPEKTAEEMGRYYLNLVE